MKNIFMTAVILSFVLASPCHAESGSAEVSSQIELLKVAGVEVFAKTAQVLGSQLNSTSVDNQYPVRIAAPDASNGYKWTAIKSFAMENGTNCWARFAEKNAVNATCVSGTHQVSNFRLNLDEGTGQKLDSAGATEDFSFGK